MSTSYKLKSSIKIRGGKVESVMEEKYTFSRAAVKFHLDALNRKGELDASNQILKGIFSEALKMPGWKNLTVSKKS
jgi:hypothetical protein